MRSILAADLAKEPPDGRFPDWLNLRVQRPGAAAGVRMRDGKRAKGKKAKTTLRPEDDQTYHVSEWGCT